MKLETLQYDVVVVGGGPGGIPAAIAAARQGAKVLLLDHSRLQEAKELAENIYCVQFASVPDFLVRIQAAKFVPHTDQSRFPSVKLL